MSPQFMHCLQCRPHGAATGLAFNHHLAWLPKPSALQQVTCPDLQRSLSLSLFLCETSGQSCQLQWLTVSAAVFGDLCSPDGFCPFAASFWEQSWAGLRFWSLSPRLGEVRRGEAYGSNARLSETGRLLSSSTVWLLGGAHCIAL